MRVLVTGAAGFLGWNLGRELRRRHPEWELTGVDSLWTGVRRRDEPWDHLWVERAEYFDAGQLYDYVYHLASPASPRHYQSRPMDTISANVQTLLGLQHLVQPGGTIFFASSSEVYGDPLVSPQPESYRGSVSTTGVRACYDESKRLCETIMVELHRAGRCRPKIARYFNVYGPGTLENDGRAMSNFICQALRGQPITVMGTGLQTRCFTYVDDVIRATVDLVEHTGDFVGPVNIGTDVETSVLRIANYVQQYVSRHTRSQPSPIVFEPAAQDDPQQRLPDLALARQVLGWDPARLTRYQEGVALTAEFMSAAMEFGY